MADYSGSDWKLTLLDSSRTFAVSNAMLGGNTVTFSYSGAQTGVNEYLSAVIMDQNGTIAYYGRILQSGSASGTASLSLPSGVTLSDTTQLYVFNEQCNGDKRTDYASALCQVTPETLQAPSVIITALPGGKVGEAYSRTLAARGSVPITWSLESGSLPAGGFGVGAHNGCARRHRKAVVVADRREIGRDFQIGAGVRRFVLHLLVGEVDAENGAAGDRGRGGGKHCETKRKLGH